MNAGGKVAASKGENRCPLARWERLIQTKEERVKLVYRIKVEVENPRHELKSNMPVDGEILL